MSMSVRDDDTGLEYAGALGARRRCSRPGATPLRPSYLRMLAEIPRFHRHGRGALLAEPDATARRRRDAARRSCERGRLLAVLPPALHGAAGRRACGRATRRSRWTTRRATCSPSSSTTACSASSARRSGAPSPAARASTSPRSAAAARTTSAPAPRSPRCSRPPTGVEVTDGNGAVDDVRRGRGRHPPRPGAGDARRADRRRSARCSRAMPYSPQHRAAAHRHLACCRGRRAPGRRGTSCAAPTDAGRRHRHLRPHPAAAAADTDTPLPRHPRRRGPRRPGDRSSTRWSTSTRSTRPTSVAAQRRLPEIDTDRIAFAGAYHGWGFHEDGARSGVAAAERLGLDVARAGRGRRPTSEPRRRTRTTIRHTRRTPFRRTFTHRSHTWLVDLDDLPDHGAARPLRGARPPRSTRRARSARNVDALPRRPTASTSTAAGSLMAANAARARLLLQPDQRVLVPRPRRRARRRRSSRCTTPTATGTPTSSTPTSRAGPRIDKAMYVSPFHGIRRHATSRRPRPRRPRCTSRSPCRTTTAPSSAPRLTGYAVTDGVRRCGQRPRPHCAARTASAPTASGCGCAGCRSGPVPTTHDRKASSDHA